MQLAKLFDKITPRLSEGSEFLWSCFGDNAWSVNFEEHIHVVYDVKTQLVYQIIFYDYNEESSFDELVPSYVWTDKDYKKEYLVEVKQRNIDDESFYEVYIGIKELFKRIKEHQHG